MDPIVIKFADALLAAAAASLLAGIVALVRVLAGMRRDVGRLVRMDALRASDLEAIARVQRPMLVGVKVSLEAQRDGRCNGNVAEAHAEISEALGAYDDYLASLVRRGR